MDRRRAIQQGVAGVAALAFAPEVARAATNAAANAAARVATDAAPHAVMLHRDRPYLDVALRASRWLERTAQRRGDSILWSADPDRPAEVGYDLYNGTTGVLPFWVELHSATNEPRAMEFVHGSAEHLLQALRSVDQKDAGLYTGLAGMGYALGLAHRVTRDDAHREGALRALALVREAAEQRAGAPNDARVHWMDSTDIISGSAGTGLYLLWADRQYGNDAALTLARGAGNALIADAERVADGQLRWKVNATIPREYPNFSHGTAGVSYFLAKLHEATRDPRFLEAAASGARYLQAIATKTTSDGRMVHHSSPGNEKLFYLSWCHGPAGTARLFHALDAITGDAAYAAFGEQLTKATIDMKVPERSPGFWNNVSRCCGNCGVSDYFVARHRSMRDAASLAFAERVARDTIARGTAEGDGMKWIQAENRTSPDAVVAQTGLMQGAAGVGLAMLHLDGAMNTRRRAVVLPDDPYM